MLRHITRILLAVDLICYFIVNNYFIQNSIQSTLICTIVSTCYHYLTDHCSEQEANPAKYVRLIKTCEQTEICGYSVCVCF
jgi:hypothetical protein